MTGSALAFPTPASLGSLDHYIQAVNRFPLLSQQEELELGRRWKDREDLDAAAMDAARQWTYAPGQRDGMPVAGTLRIPVDYSFDP